MNLTFAMHAESRYNEAVFNELQALLTAPGGAGEAVVLLDMYRAPGPANSQFAVGLEVESGRRRWTAEYSVAQWKDLPDPGPVPMARALADDIRTLLAAGPPDEPEDARPKRLFRRR